MSEDAFTLPPENMISEQVTLAEHRMALGLLHIEGAGVRVVIWDGERLRHMAGARARRWAQELVEGPYAETFTPVSAALSQLADRVDEIAAMVAANREAVAAGLAEMAVEGRA